MGLETSHNCWHGAYSAFSRWRNKLAEVAGYSFSKKGDPPIYDVPDLDWGHLPPRWAEGEWGSHVEKDPLVYLLAHSDCEGVIHPAQAKPLADRLDELLPKLPDDSGGGHIWNWRQVTERFIKGLRAAVEAGEDVDFH